MAIDRFTFFGLALAMLGWIVLVADFALSALLAQPGGMAAAAALRSDIFSVAETTIFSGFALAIIGTLRGGFGALHRFFGTVLERASVPRIITPTPVSTPAPEPETVAVPAVEHNAHRVAARPRQAHNYVILPNGAVEVETLLGTRVFASLDEAKDFIR